MTTVRAEALHDGFLSDVKEFSVDVGNFFGSKTLRFSIAQDDEGKRFEKFHTFSLTPLHFFPDNQNQPWSWLGIIGLVCLSLLLLAIFCAATLCAVNLICVNKSPR